MKSIYQTVQKRSASHYVRQQMMPSVSILIARHRIPPHIVDTIVRSGPRKNLLKGDVLSYISSNPIMSPSQPQSIVDESMSARFTYYKYTINVEKVQSAAKRSGISMHDYLCHLYAQCIPEKLELGVVRETLHGTLKARLSKKNLPKDIYSQFSKEVDITNTFCVYQNLTGRQTWNEYVPIILAAELTSGKKFVPDMIEYLSGKRQRPFIQDPFTIEVPNVVEKDVIKELGRMDSTLSGSTFRQSSNLCIEIEADERVLSKSEANLFFKCLEQAIEKQN